MRTEGNSLALRVLVAGLLAGVLDIIAALVFWGLQGVAPVRILQGIASGLLGAAAREGGAATAALGLVLHFSIMLIIAAIYVAAASRMVFLRRHWYVAGTLFGVVVYVVMNAIVLPLSAFPNPVVFSVERVVPALAIQIVFVGWPIAFVARHAGRH